MGKVESPPSIKWWKTSKFAKYWLFIFFAAVLGPPPPFYLPRLSSAKHTQNENFSSNSSSWSGVALQQQWAKSKNKQRNSNKNIAEKQLAFAHQFNRKINVEELNALYSVANEIFGGNFQLPIIWRRCSTLLRTRFCKYEGKRWMFGSEKWLLPAA